MRVNHERFFVRWGRGLLTALVLFIVANANAVIVFPPPWGPGENTSPPSNDPAASGWNYEGSFGSFLGTPIAPHFFLTAKHIGQAGSNFGYASATYTLVTHFNDPFSDFTIWQVAETFPTFAPLYSKGDEAGLRVVDIGRGTQRGSEIRDSNSNLRGWGWGIGDGVQRWGENIVAEIVNFSSGPNDTIYATFDFGGLPSECHLSSGDSGGGLFIQDGTTWKLAGINYGVDGHFYTDSSGGGQFDAALFDARDYYYQDNDNPPHYTQITGTDPVPTGFYATRVSSKLGWIYSVTDPSGDADGNGRSNLLDYALLLNSVSQPGYGMTPVTKEPGFWEITYRRITNASSLQYEVQKSTDLITWMAANPQEQSLRTDENVETVKATVAAGSGNPLFLRIRITETQSGAPPTSSPAVYKRRTAR